MYADRCRVQNGHPFLRLCPGSLDFCRVFLENCPPVQLEDLSELSKELAKCSSSHSTLLCPSGHLSQIWLRSIHVFTICRVHPGRDQVIYDMCECHTTTSFNHQTLRVPSHPENSMVLNTSKERILRTNRFKILEHSAQQSATKYDKAVVTLAATGSSSTGAPHAN